MDVPRHLRGGMTAMAWVLQHSTWIHCSSTAPYVLRAVRGAQP
jgi:hypothetical protein